MEQQKQQLEQQMLAAVIPNTSVMPPATVGQQQQQQQKNIPSLMAQKVVMPIMDDNDHFTNQPNQQNQQNMDNNALYQNNTGNNFFIPDLSKPPPGFLSGNTSNMAQMSSAMQQAQYPTVNSNIPVNQNLNNPPPNLMAPADMLGNINHLNVDLLNVNAALQLVQQQQHQQLHQTPQIHHQQLISYDQQQQQTMVSTSGVGSDDECVPPPPSLLLEQEQEQVPSAAYYDLPAGLMVPLIRLEDYRYKPLDPVDIRLPPPAPQNERLTNALAAFYSLPTHDRPRDK